MGHHIRAIIGTYASIQKLADSWNYAQEIKLPQNYGMIFVTDTLLDEIDEFIDIPVDFSYSELDYLSTTLEYVLKQYSLHTQLAYLETDYAGGVGTQAGMLYENGKVCIAPHSGKGIINRLLRELGIRCLPGKDEFDTLNLGKYRHMPQ